LLGVEPTWHGRAIPADHTPVVGGFNMRNCKSNGGAARPERGRFRGATLTPALSRQRERGLWCPSDRALRAFTPARSAWPVLTSSVELNLIGIELRDGGCAALGSKLGCVSM
jgi:hypothetical protein